MSFFKKLTSQKPAPTLECDKKIRQITCLAGAGVAFLAMVLLIIRLAGFESTYVWSAVALGVGMMAFFGLAFARYFFAGNKLIARFADASVWFVLFGVYTPIELILVRQEAYENGSIVAAWVIFGLIALFSAFFFICALASTRKFRLFGSFCFLVMVFAPLFGIPGLLNAYFFAPALAIIFLILTMACFAATPIIFWFFDKYDWQMKVFYILMAAGTFFGALIPVIGVFAGR